MRGNGYGGQPLNRTRQNAHANNKHFISVRAMMFRKLRTRMIAHIIWIVSVVILVAFFLVYELHQAALKNHLRSDAERASQMVESVLVDIMQQKNPELLNALLPQLSRLHHIETLQIIRPDGKIAFSSNPAERDRPSQFIGLYHRLDSGKNVFAFNVMEGQNTSFFKFRKLENKKVCQDCHDSTRAVNGILFVKTSDQITFHSLRMELIPLTAIAVSVILLLSLATYTLFLRSVDRPVQELQKAMEQIKNGDFSVRIAQTGKDELGQLAEGLNSMAQKLQWAQHQLVEQHRQQMNRAEALAKMGELATGLAHEIKNPISGIVFALNSILRDIPENDKRREIFEELIKQANRVEQNLEALLSYAKENRLQKSPTDINSIIERLLLFVKQQQDMESIEVSSELDPELPQVLVDARQIEQVLLNLIINAIQAMPEGGKLRVTTAYQSSAKKIRILIQDSGIGIPQNIQDKIFQPFFSTKENGTGLGLTLCKEIVLKHSGNLTFQSKPGEGTIFIIELPIGRLEPL